MMLLQILNFRGLPFLNIGNNLDPKNAHFSKRSSISPYSSVRCVSEHACNNIPVHDIAGVFHNKVRFFFFLDRLLLVLDNLVFIFQFE